VPILVIQVAYKFVIEDSFLRVKLLLSPAAFIQRKCGFSWLTWEKCVPLADARRFPLPSPVTRQVAVAGEQSREERHRVVEVGRAEHDST